MKKILFITDSTLSGVGCEAVSEMAAYQLCQKTSHYWHDLSAGGMTIAGRKDFSYAPAVALDLNDMRPAIRRLPGDFIFLLHGSNDWELGHDPIYVKSELKAWIQFCQNQNKQHIICSPFTRDAEDQLMLDMRIMQSQVATSTGSLYLHGPDMLDGSNPDLWLDGAHPSVIGINTATTNIATFLLESGVFL